jgi:hypothetical protein
MSNINFSEYIYSDIQEFIKNSSQSQELEIIISTEKIPINNYLNEITFSYLCKDNVNCKICNETLFNKTVRVVKKCNHQFHKKCFDKLFKKKIEKFNIVDEKTKWCDICYLE